MLRSGADLGQARRLRYSIISQESILCFSIQWRSSSAALGFGAAEVRWHAHHHRLHQDFEDVLHITEQLDGSAGGAQTGDMAK